MIGFAHYKVGAWGLEIIRWEEQSYERKGTETQARTWRATQRMLNSPAFISIP